jgi:hypothetical protein
MHLRKGHHESCTCNVYFLERVNCKIEFVTCITIIGFVTCQEESWPGIAAKEEEVDKITKEEQEFFFEG